MYKYMLYIDVYIYICVCVYVCIGVKKGTEEKVEDNNEDGDEDADEDADEDERATVARSSSSSYDIDNSSVEREAGAIFPMHPAQHVSRRFPSP